MYLCMYFLPSKLLLLLLLRCSIYLLSRIRYISRYTLTYTQRRRKAVKIPKILQQKRWMEVLFSNDGSLL